MVMENDLIMDLTTIFVYFKIYSEKDKSLFDLLLSIKMMNVVDLKLQRNLQFLLFELKKNKEICFLNKKLNINLINLHSKFFYYQ